MLSFRSLVLAVLVSALAVLALAGARLEPAQALDSPQIAEVQGAAHISPLNGQSVSGVEGVVTARRTAGGRGVWIEDPTPDSSDATSDGVFVFTGTTPVARIGTRFA